MYLKIECDFADDEDNVSCEPERLIDSSVGQDHTKSDAQVVGNCERIAYFL